MDMALAALTALGYVVRYHKLRADDYMLPQRRCRLYFFGILDDGRRDCEAIHGRIADYLASMKSKLEISADPASVF